MRCKHVRSFAMIALLVASATMTTTASAETKRRVCLLGLTIGGQSVEVGCIGPKQNAAQPSIKRYCGRGGDKPFQPFRWSKNDTQATKDQAREHNAAGRAVGCW